MKGLAVVLVALMIWTAGLLAFADRVVRLTPAPSPAPADGVVALTGGSDLRLRAATALLEGGKGRRLLVSGVNHKVSRERIWSVTGAAKPLFDCCVDLDFDAADTIGNAREAARWARAMGYRSLILVTADYHTPRAALELTAVMPEARISVYPVVTPDLDARHWPDTSEGARRMAAEYMKYLVALGREGIIGLGPRPSGPGPSGQVSGGPGYPHA
ncbi:MAG TPA: ElyC/SanA/YdcF family protein [Caulobacteraceae bacterium]|nr:ElyC/SanA/YdcF family protein [Caulobacteraceae bacterium]